MKKKLKFELSFTLPGQPAVPKSQPIFNVIWRRLRKRPQILPQFIVLATSERYEDTMVYRMEFSPCLIPCLLSEICIIRSGAASPIPTSTRPGCPNVCRSDDGERGSTSNKPQPFDFGKTNTVIFELSSLSCGEFDRFADPPSSERRYFLPSAVWDQFFKIDALSTLTESWSQDFAGAEFWFDAHLSLLFAKVSDTVK